MHKGQALISSRLVLAKSRLVLTAFLTGPLPVLVWADKAEPAPWRRNRLERAR
jgi:hypothetical protein